MWDCFFLNGFSDDFRRLMFYNFATFETHPTLLRGEKPLVFENKKPFCGRSKKRVKSWASEAMLRWTLGKMWFLLLYLRVRLCLPYLT